jgi:tetratricopeptide (TPR) repeat protein
MREGRSRRATYRDKGQQGAALEAPRRLDWARASIIGVALATVVMAWLGGFFDSVLDRVIPSGSEAFCTLRETLENRWPFATRPATSKRFSILIATIDHDDADHTYTRAVAKAFLKRGDIDRIETCRVLRFSDVGRAAEIFAVTTARKWLEDLRADVLIAGEMLKKDETVSLWFIGKDPTQALTFRLDANLLKQDFAEAASTQLLAVALSAIKPATAENGRYLVVVLRPIAVRLWHLLASRSGLTAAQKANLESALGITLFVIGDKAGENGALTDAAGAFHAALQEKPSDQVPLARAVTQANLGLTLATLGARETGTAHLEEAVTAFRAALEEYTRDQLPLGWAATQHSLGNALERLGERESGTTHLAEAVTAYRAALEERTRERVPLDWAATQNNLGFVLETLGERESGTAHLEEAVAAYRTALEERTRNRVPLDWAATQNNLGLTLATLGARETGTAHLEEAVAAWEVCLTVIAAVWPQDWVQDVHSHVDRARAEITRRMAK